MSSHNASVWILNFESGLWLTEAIIGRDSAKDQAVVFIFIIATVGLLVYAGIEPWVGRWTQNWRERRNYIPISGQGDQ